VFAWFPPDVLHPSSFEVWHHDYCWKITGLST
jgi:hypothetical protein